MNYLALPTSLSMVLNTGDTVARTLHDCYSRLTSPQAIATYQALGRMTLHLTIALAQLAYASCLWAYAQIKVWADHQVNQSLPQAEAYLTTTEELFAQTDAIAQLTDAELEAEFNDSFELPGMWEASDFDSPDYRIPTQAQSMGSPIAVCRVAPSTSYEDALDREQELQSMTLKQLKPIAEKLNLPIRKVLKADLIDSILEAEGYQK